ncbi:MAG: methylated-DNA--[protein]-cysteine S-methyltransferase [Dehalococcoidia bacterium]
MSWYGTLETALGTVYAGGSDEGVHRIEFAQTAEEAARFLERLERDSGSAPVEDAVASREAVEELRGYFAGKRETFDLPLAPKGTPFQQAVWGALLDIPYGETSTYGAVARRIGRPSGPRAVGMAIGRNPISVVVPCHRVVGANGTLTGYGGGLDRKEWLLALEGLPRTSWVREALAAAG